MSLQFGSWSRFASAAVTFAIVLIGLIGAGWAIGAAQSDASSTTTAQNLEPVFDALLGALAWAPYLLAGMFAVTAAVAAVMSVAKLNGGGIR